MPFKLNSHSCFRRDLLAHGTDAKFECWQFEGQVTDLVFYEMPTLSVYTAITWP